MSLQSGLRLGPYEVLELLGAGGMGEVWRAQDTRLDRFVAVKVLQGAWAEQSEWLSRFRLEAKAVAALNHPNILGIFDIGADGGYPFVVMELLEGETLRARLLKGALSPKAAMDLAQQMAGGLAAAHDKGIVHRDLKPENLWITKDGRLKILDFGLAKRSAETGSVNQAEDATLDLQHQTQAGLVLGTAAYMSPEQARGDLVDARSDLFSFGVVLWEMLMGRKAFARPSIAETMAAILKEEPESLDDAPATIPPGLRRVVEHCLDKRREGRFQSARDLAFALEAITEAPSAPSTLSGQTRASGPSLAVLPFVNMSPSREQDYFSDGISEEIINALMKLQGLRVAARTSSFAFKGKDEDARRIGQALGVAHLLEGSVRMAGNKLRVTAQLISAEDGCQLWSGRFDRALEDIFEVQDEIARAIVTALEVNLLQAGEGRIVPSATRDPEAYDFYLRGRAFYNQRHAAKAIECFEAAIARDTGFVQAHTGLADAYAGLGFYGGMQPLEAYTRAKAAADAALKLAPDSAEAHVSLGIIEHYYGWDFAKQEAVLVEAIRINPNLAPAHYWLSALFILRLMPDRGEPHARRAVDLDPLNPNAQCNLAMIHYVTGRYEEAAQVLDRVRRLDPEALLPIHQLADLGLSRGRPLEAVGALEQAMAGPGGGSTILRGMLGALYAAGGREKDARAMLERLRVESRGRYVAPLHMAFIEAHLGDMDAAFASMTRAIDERNALAWFYILNDPAMAVIRSDARYPALVKCLGFATQAH